MMKFAKPIDLFLTILWAICSLPAFADPTEEQKIWESFDRASMDAPIAALKEAIEQVKRIDHEASPRLWLRYHAEIFANSAAEEYYKTVSEAEVESWISKARQLGSPELEAKLLMVKARFWEKKPREIVESLYESAMGLCQETDDSDCSFVYESYVYYLYFISDYAKAMQWMARGIRDDPNLPLRRQFAQVRLKNLAAVMLDTVGDHERSKVLYRDVLNFAHKHQLRYCESVAAFNLGTLEENFGNYAEAKALYERSAEVARSLGDVIGIAWAQHGLYQTFKKQGLFAEAKKHLDDCFQSITGRQAGDLERVAEQSRVEILVELGQFEEAEKHLRIAEKMTPESYVSEWIELYYFHFRIARAKSSWKEAATVLEKAFSMKRKQSLSEKKQRLEKHQTLTNLKLEEQRNKQLTADLISAQKIRNLSLAFAALLVLFLLGAAALSWQSRILTQQRKKMELVLSVIEEGIALIDRDLRFAAVFSPHIATLCERDVSSIKGAGIAEVLFARSNLSPEQARMSIEILQSSMGEDTINWELNAHQLPTQLTFDSPPKTLELFWQPLVTDTTVQEILLCVRNVTEKVKIQKEADAVQFKVKLLTEIASVQSERALGYLNDLMRWQPSHFSDRPEQSLMDIHTSKGLARSLGLKTLSNALHQLEDALRILPPAAINAHISSWIVGDGADILSKYAEASKILSQKSTGSTYTLAELQYEIHSNVLKRCHESEIQLTGVTFVNECSDWTQAEITLLGRILVHAVNNAIDHGYIFPMRRGKTPGHVRLDFRFFADGPYHCLEMKDYGCGIDYKALKKVAQEKGLTLATEEELNSLIFATGSSTAASVTETSGRGIGMGAIRSAVESAGGTLDFRNHSDGGAVLRISLPVMHERDSNMPHIMGKGA